MKLGVFDSGLGGLLITKAIREADPDIDIVYFGDTLHLPYGNRSDEAIAGYTRRAMDAMFQSGCQLIIIACNTASVACLRYLQQQYLPKEWPDRNILGVIVPTLEAAIEAGYQRLGLIGTHAIVRSNVYDDELRKINPDLFLKQVATPLLVPMIENGGEPWLRDVLAHYLANFKVDDLDCLILGCTHYPRLKGMIREYMGQGVDILSQDDIIPAKVVDYLRRHSEHGDKISRNGTTHFFVSDLTENYRDAARVLYGGADIEIGVMKT